MSDNETVLKDAPIIKVDVNEVTKLHKQLDLINKIPFEMIEWYDGNTKLDISEEVLKDWKYVGLSNVHFVTTHFYEG